MPVEMALPGDTPPSPDLSFSFSFSFDMGDDGESSFRLGASCVNACTQLHLLIHCCMCCLLPGKHFPPLILPVRPADACGLIFMFVRWHRTRAYTGARDACGHAC